MYELTYFSPTIIYKSKINFDDDIVNCLEDMDYIRYGTNNGDHSKNFYILKEPSFLRLSNEICLHIEEYARGVLKISNAVKFNLTTSWISKHGPGDFSQNHHHKNSIFSGIVYLKTPINSGNILFGKRNGNLPDFLNIEFTELNVFNCDSWSFVPQAGDIFLFPSLLSHYTGINESSENRFCLAFNSFPVGKLSDGIRELMIR